MAPNLTARFVRLQDRFALRSAPVWRVNERTGALEARAGLSWTGVREYRTSEGLIRVLRRPAQVNSPGHLRTLHRLTATEGHPAGDVDLTPFNSDELGVGAVGDDVAIEACRGYPRPVGNVSILRPSTIVKMVEPAVWKIYQERFPESAEIQHSGGAPLTGTSLGYNALWYGPHIETEIVGERDGEEGEGSSLIGEWLGPHGPERYDIEHIVDPACEIVQRLVKDQDFDPELLGGNHFAVALPYLGGRGAQQSEMMRIVDSREVGLRRTRGSLSVAVPRKPKFQVLPRSAKGWLDAVTKTFDAVDPRWAARQAEVAKVVEGDKLIPPCTVTYGTNEHGVLETSFQFEGDAEPMTVVPPISLDGITQEFIADLYLWSRAPHDEILGAGGEQLPECPATHDAAWSTGAARDLPIAESSAAWDGDAAAASLFAAAGWPDKPDAARANRGFLIYDADEPELKGSYKLPFARVHEGQLEVLVSGLRAAASRLPQTDAPQDVLDRARAVLDHYFARLEDADASDSNADESNSSNPEGQKNKMTTPNPTHVVDFGLSLSRDDTTTLRKRGIAAPSNLTLSLDMVDANKAREHLTQINELVGALMQQLAESEDATGEAKEGVVAVEEKMADMMTKEEAQALVDEMKAKLAEAEKQLVEAAKTSDSLKKANDSLTSELEPLREQQLAELAGKVLATGDSAFKEAEVKACKDAAELRRLVVSAKMPKFAKATDVAIDAAFGMFITNLPEQDASGEGSGDSDGEDDAAKQGRDGKKPVSSLSSLPRIAPGRGRDEVDSNSKTPAPEAPSSAQRIGSGLAALGS